MHVRILVHLHWVMAKQVDESTSVHVDCAFMAIRMWPSACMRLRWLRTTKTECFCSIFLLFLVVMRSTGIQTKRQEYFNVLFIYATFCIYSCRFMLAPNRPQQFASKPECTGITIKSQTEKEKTNNDFMLTWLFRPLKHGERLIHFSIQSRNWVSVRLPKQKSNSCKICYKFAFSLSSPLVRSQCSHGVWFGQRTHVDLSVTSLWHLVEKTTNLFIEHAATQSKRGKKRYINLTM